MVEKGIDEEEGQYQALEVRHIVRLATSMPMTRWESAPRDY